MKARPSKDMKPGVIHKMRLGNELVITKYENAANVHVRFIDTGYELVAQASHIRIGSVVDKMSPTVYGVGFIGSGRFKPSENGRNTLAYDRWNNMLQRCFCSKFQKSRPTYKGCTVCSEWLNFQNFAEWFYANYPNDGNSYHLDKDKLANGGKLYSPETCCFLTIDENNAVAQRKCYTFISPDGKSVKLENLRKYCLENKINRSGMSMLACGKLKSYKGWTLPN